MIRKTALCLLPGLIFGLCSLAGADRLGNKIRAAATDIKVFSPATAAEYIQWAPLLYLNQTYGAEIYVAIFQMSPAFACKIQSTPDGQFHLAHIGLGAEYDQRELVDSVIACLFNGYYPDLAIFEAGSPEDSLLLASLLIQMKELSQSDSTAITRLENIFIRGTKDENAHVVFNDAEIYGKYRVKAGEISRNFYPFGPINYTPEYYRRYLLLTPPVPGQIIPGDFLYGTGYMPCRLPQIFESRLPEGPEKSNILRRLDSYLSAIGKAGQPGLSPVEILRSLIKAHADIIWLDDMARSEGGYLAEIGARDLIRAYKHKTFTALEEAVGIEWQGNLEIRETPFGRIGRLSLDITLTGPRPVELSIFKFMPPAGEAIVIDPISKKIQPHQRFYREYPVDLSLVDPAGLSGDSLMFSVDAVVEGLTISLLVPLSGYAEEGLSLRFLPGYAFLSPFTEGQITSLAQPFDWQLQITKPYGSELDGRIVIETPEAIVVGTFNNHIFMPQGVTAKYRDIHFAAGRSIGFDRKTVRASLEVGGIAVAETSADVRVVRCDIPETRDIAFVPDPEGRLEDFLRISKASFQPFTPHSLIRATLEAYDLLVIGSDADGYFNVLRQVGDRLREFVRNGGEILILGQSFGWPHDIFDVPIYTSKSVRPTPARVVQKNHRILNEPYLINIGELLASPEDTPGFCPAIINGGAEIISAGELGSYLRVFSIGEGHVIYCGLPVLEMAAELNVEAIHLMANLLNFGYGK